MHLTCLSSAVTRPLYIILIVFSTPVAFRCATTVTRLCNLCCSIEIVGKQQEGCFLSIHYRSTQIHFHRPKFIQQCFVCFNRDVNGMNTTIPFDFVMNHLRSILLRFYYRERLISCQQLRFQLLCIYFHRSNRTGDSPHTFRSNRLGVYTLVLMQFDPCVLDARWILFAAAIARLRII